ncbi:MAG: hypothetical protein BM557_08250 [Flavobacterium sp. MedPE-SWcel]|uniref:DNA/RNA helicase domain-containing protein n=1 Tax=uncultured Flavobacterium sp. TaxID=165435 RepID=UPI0009225EC1|nr:DNA/RNA helicase domain-containing protein [uncultured Flavobacterium sp.]OIQ17670.1 MAG: hypothetical protein BM557_08250 [Flavobacterium sp. MedPE-SWcel]
MKEINLLSLIQAYKNLDESLYKKYIEYLKITPKKQELKDIECLIKTLQSIDCNIALYDNYFLGYTIPQISKEFDLLRFGENYNVNIELKSKNIGEERIKKQLSKNKYYLDFLNKKIFNFTFLSDENKFYKVDSNSNLIEVKFTELIKVLKNQKLEKTLDINSKFTPSSYLVSPFNSTNKFIKSEYFLTLQQEDFKKKALNIINKNGTSFLSICGKAGTGKTLLIFDIAKECINQNIKTLTVHCGGLNEGHNKLIRNQGWKIIPIKSIKYQDCSIYDLIIIDEAQRIRISQLNSIINQIRENNGTCIFSYDMTQCLTKKEIDNNIDEYLTKKTEHQKFNLTNKVRTNREIAHFTTGLFNKAKFLSKIEISNVQINYFENLEDAVNFIKVLKLNNWKVINYTPSTVHTHPYEKFSLTEEDNTHQVIGQEFDNVVAVIDSHFYYKNTGELSTKNYIDKPYYLTNKMLYQIMTRARKKLNIVIIDNKEVMEQCLSILKPNLHESSFVE